MDKELSSNQKRFQVRELRYRMGWTQAELARSIGCKIETVSAWEQGSLEPEAKHESLLGLFQIQAEANSQMLQMQPVAEHLMHAQGLAQIHEDEVADCLTDAKVARDGALAHLNFKS